MSPSTKNLKERIEEILKRMSFGITTNRESHPPRTAEKPLSLATNALASLLSSELSLAVKGLREAVERTHGHVLALHMCQDETPYVGPEETTKFVCLVNALERFDAKAKEILGESS